MTQSRKIPGYVTRRGTFTLPVPPDMTDREINEAVAGLIEAGLKAGGLAVFKDHKPADIKFYVVKERSEQPRHVKRRELEKSQEKAKVLLANPGQLAKSPHPGA